MRKLSLHELLEKEIENMDFGDLEKYRQSIIEMALENCDDVTGDKRQLECAVDTVKYYLYGEGRDTVLKTFR